MAAAPVSPSSVTTPGLLVSLQDDLPELRSLLLNLMQEAAMLCIVARRIGPLTLHSEDPSG